MQHLLAMYRPSSAQPHLSCSAPAPLLPSVTATHLHTSPIQCQQRCRKLPHLRNVFRITYGGLCSQELLCSKSSLVGRLSYLVATWYGSSQFVVAMLLHVPGCSEPPCDSFWLQSSNNTSCHQLPAACCCASGHLMTLGSVSVPCMVSSLIELNAASQGTV